MLKRYIATGFAQGVVLASMYAQNQLWKLSRMSIKVSISLK